MHNADIELRPASVGKFLLALYLEVPSDVLRRNSQCASILGYKMASKTGKKVGKLHVYMGIIPKVFGRVISLLSICILSLAIDPWTITYLARACVYVGACMRG